MNTDDHKISYQEHAEIIRRKAELELHKQADEVTTLDQLLIELGIPGKDK